MVTSLQELQNEAHRIAKDKGWWEPQIVQGQVIDPDNDQPFGFERPVLVQRSFGDQISLMHSEASEALEAFREKGLDNWYKVTDQSGVVKNYSPEELDRAQQAGELIDCDIKPEGAFVELADCIIRILDTAGSYEVDMQGLIVEKMAYNKTRSYRHGNKAL